MKKKLLMAGRILVACAALYFATRKINRDELKMFEWGSSLFWLILAILFYNLSQCISAYRLLKYYRFYMPEMQYLYNLKLYYRGMFYNLFLPGGVGGDAYKIITLKNSNNTYRQLTTTTLMDRVTGLGVLMLIITVMGMIVPEAGPFAGFFAILPWLALAGTPVYYLVIYFFFKPFHRILPLAGVLSVLIQGLQFLSFLFILRALQVLTPDLTIVAFLFFTSSVIAALPLSIGGIGTRELALATGAGYFGFSATKMVTASLFFFLLVVISSLAGWLISGSPVQKKRGGKASVNTLSDSASVK